MRNLILVLGDQLDLSSSAYDGFETDVDGVWMAKVEHEASHVWCHQLRIALFFSAMRHFRKALKSKDYRVEYHELTKDRSNDSGRTFDELLSEAVSRLKPEKLIVVQPGDFRVLHELQQAADGLGVELEVRSDTHFYSTIENFRDYAEGRKNLRLEYFYREMRKSHDVLMDDSGEPTGGQWNFDHDNRESFGRSGPQDLPRLKTFRPDEITKQVIELVGSRFADHPGHLNHFNLPVTRRQALRYLRDFIEHGLPEFGKWEDAMWEDEPFLYHSRLSAPLNLKLLSPRECVDTAVEAYRTQQAPINSVEGFVRQILGWREFIRGVYWTQMPDYADLNHLDHEAELPQFFWDGDTDMNCVRQSMQHVLNHGYSHHIQRLMVLGNFAQLWGVHPLKFHHWHMAMYLDAVDWVSLPNTLGMSQYGDGGIVGTKPYCSSGNYINKMSNFCKGCRYDFKQRTGDDACPFTTLYWDFMQRHRDQLSDHPRMKFPMKHLEKLHKDPAEIDQISQRVEHLRKSLHGAHADGSDAES